MGACSLSFLLRWPNKHHHSGHMGPHQQAALKGDQLFYNNLTRDCNPNSRTHATRYAWTDLKTFLDHLPPHFSSPDTNRLEDTRE